MRLLLLAAAVLVSISQSYGAFTNILSELGSRLDTSCTNEQNCEREINEIFLRRVESLMNTEIDPCENFLDYACGNWVPVNKNITTHYAEVIFNYNKKITEIFEKLRKEKFQSDIIAAYEKALNYYKSCRTMKSLDLRGILLELPPVNQQWPIYENRRSIPWNLDSFVWWKVFAKIQSYGLDDMFFSLTFNKKHNQDPKYILLNTYTPQAKLKLTDDILKAMGNYTKSQKSVLKWRLQKFEERLFDSYQLMFGDDSSEEAGDSRISIEDLQLRYPDIEWQVYFDILLQNFPEKLSPNMKIVKVNAPKTFENIIYFLNEASRETVAIYMMAKVLIKLKSEVVVKSEKSQQEQNCVQDLRKLSQLITNQLYEENYYAAIRAESDVVISEIFQNLKAKLKDLIRDNKLELSDFEIEQLQLKGDKMRLIIGDVHTNKTYDLLNDYYRMTDIRNQTNFYHNRLALMNTRFLLDFRAGLHSDLDIDELYIPLSDNSPYNFESTNTVYMGYAFMRMPSFHHKLHRVFQYASLGFILGHEIMHGFDSTGIFMDAVGNQASMGYDISKRRPYKKAIECLKKQETVSMDERIADVSGLRLVMDAFFNDRSIKTSQYHTHSTNLSNQQLFFISMSQFFCEKHGAEHLDLEHDSPSVRLVYTMAHTHEFAHAFQCNAEAAMRPEEFCQLW